MVDAATGAGVPFIVANVPTMPVAVAKTLGQAALEALCRIAYKIEDSIKGKKQDQNPELLSPEQPTPETPDPKSDDEPKPE
jgi:hypothetical protein